MRVLLYIPFLLGTILPQNGEAILGIPSFLEWGSCPNVLPQKNLDLTKFSGIWYTQAAVPNEYIPAEACRQTNYKWDGKLMISILHGLTATGKPVNKTSFFHLDHSKPKDRPVLIAKEKGMPEAPYTIYATDYDGFACSYSCLDYFGFRALFLWTLSRDPSHAEGALKRCDSLSKRLGISSSKLEPVVQGKVCPYWLGYLQGNPGNFRLDSAALTRENLEERYYVSSSNLSQKPLLGLLSISLIFGLLEFL